MTENKTKKQLLEAANYQYNFTREIYFNRKDKKVFSQNAIDDNDEEWLSERLADPIKNDWSFYFNEGPGDKIKERILSELNEK